MNILIQLSHPAQYHSFKNVARNLMNDGHQVLVVIKSKDILEDLLKEAGLPYVNVNEHAHRGSQLGVLWDMFVREVRMVRLCRKHKIDLLMGSTPEVAHVGWFLRKYRVNIGEDDAAILSNFIKLTKSFVQTYLAPESCNMGVIEHKTVHYRGFQKLAYMHPNWFKADAEVVRKYGINPDEPYFLIRFAKLNAHHDSGVSGISTDIARRLVEILENSACEQNGGPKETNECVSNGESGGPEYSLSKRDFDTRTSVPNAKTHGKIYITSERALEPEFEQYRLHINPLDIHHVMAFATLYIGDSQSMANEAAMLGVPSLRFNDFVGAKKIGVMEEMEKVYGLTYGISSHDPEKLYAKVEELLAMPNLREEFQARREKMLAEKIDVTAFLTWFIENYPASAKEAKNADTDFWKQFK